jgi:hypothetical protein
MVLELRVKRVRFRQKDEPRNKKIELFQQKDLVPSLLSLGRHDPFFESA